MKPFLLATTLAFAGALTACQSTNSGSVSTEACCDDGSCAKCEAKHGHAHEGEDCCGVCQEGDAAEDAAEAVEEAADAVEEAAG